MMKVTPKREWHYPLALERQYSVWLVSHVEAIAAVIRRHLTAAPTSLEEVNRLMGDISRDMPVFTESRAAQMYQAVDRYNMTEWDAITKSVFGFPISTMPVKELVRQDIDEEALWVSENLDLITSIDTETLSKVKGELIRAIQNNVDRDIVTSVLMQAIRRIVEVEKNRARLIATDQVGKLNGRLTMQRQQDAGITEFKWKSAGDSRVRPLHRAYNGHVYKWSKPPADGYPGYPIRCRCVALPVIDLDKVVVQPQKGRMLPVGEPVYSLDDVAKMAMNLIPPTDAFIKTLADKDQLPYTVGKKGEERFYSDDGDAIYPPNNGAVGKAEKITLHAGVKILTRYGANRGKYVSPEGITYEQRALPRKTDKRDYHEFIIVKDIPNVMSATIAAWFGQVGGGTQYLLPDSIEHLINRGYLKEVK